MSAPQTAEFIAEAKEHLAEVCDQLLRLESCSGDTARDRIEQMLRAVHSVKGGAGYFGLRHIEQVAHKMETAVEAILVGKTLRDTRAVDTLLAATDRIASLLDDIERSNSIDIEDVIARLDEILTAGSSSAPDAKLDLTAKETLPSVYHVPIAINLSACQSTGTSPLEVFARVRQLGDIKEGFLDAPEVDLEKSPPLGPVIWRAKVATALNADEFARQLGVPQSSEKPAKPPAERPSREEPVTSATPTVAPAPPATVSVDRGTTIRIPVVLADRMMNLAGELLLVRNQSRRFAEAGQTLPAAVVQRFDAVTTALQETVLQTRMQPIGNLFGKFPRLVRDLTRQLGKQIELHIAGAEVELDKTILDAISDPLTHLMRNACDHGAERPEARQAQGKSPTVQIELTARHWGDQIVVTVADDGRGIDREVIARQAVKQGLRNADELARLSDRELLSLILMPGFSTAAKVTDVSGRGVGMDVVKTNIAQLGGSLEINSVAGKGTTFTLRLPLTVAIIPGLLVTAADDRYVIPQKDLQELVYVDSQRTDSNHSRVRIEWTRGQEMLRLRGKLLPLVRLTNVLYGTNTPSASTRSTPGIVAVVKAGSRRYGLLVDSVLANEEVVVKPMHGRLRKLAIYSGATILGDGSIALILNAAGIALLAQARFGSDAEASVDAASEQVIESKTILLMRQTNGQGVAVPATQVRRIVMVSRDKIERVGDGRYVTIDGVPTQVVSLGAKNDAEAFGDHISYVLLPRDGDQTIGYVVNEVLRTEQIHAEDVHAFPADPTALGSTVLREGITPLVNLRRPSKAWDFSKANSASQARILVVDDTQFFRDVVGRYLTEAGYRVTAAENGAAALEQLQRESFDLVVSDIEMPVMDGLMLAAAVREMDSLRQLPMLALSTLTGDEVVAKAKAHGFNAYEVKLDQASLLSKVRDLLEGSAAGTLSQEVCDVH